MLSIFKRNKKNVEGIDSAVDSSELLDEGTASSDVEIKTELVFHPEAPTSTEDRYYYGFLNNELPLLKENQLSLSGIELKKLENGYAISAFVRNSLNKGVKFQKMPLLLIGPNGEKLGRKEFDLSQLGELPALSSMPWFFVFEEKDLFVSEIPRSDWKLAFELKAAKKPHSLDLADSWEKSLADGDKEKLETMVSEMTPPKPGEVNFMGLQIKQADEGKLHVTMLIRNGSEKNISLQQLPLLVEDATGDVIARGGFTLDSFEVKANTSKPWTFIFPKELVQKENPDFSSWKAYPPQQKHRKNTH